jgi:hypothetical protein
MRKVLSFAIAILMVLTVVSGSVFRAEEVKAANTNAIFVANRFAPVGARWNGTQLVEDKTRYFNGVGTAWGTTDYEMPGPGAYLSVAVIDPANPLLINETPDVVDLLDPNASALKVSQTRSTPLYWTEFYLTVEANKGQSQEYDRWFAVVDNMGQLWFDPDGRFNDSRYYAAADPDTEAYRYVQTLVPGHKSDDCKNNPNCKVDPSVANNTQGPYQYMPTDYQGQFPIGWKSSPTSFSLFNYSVANASGGMFFRTPWGRVFQVGFVDMPDFPLQRGAATTITLPGVERPTLQNIGTNLVDTAVGQKNVITDTTVMPYAYGNLNGRTVDWDFNPTPLNLVRFNDGFDTGQPIPAPADIPSYMGVNYFVMDDYVFDYGEEWHAANVKLDPPPVPPNGSFPSTGMDIYDPGEWIYRAGANSTIVIPGTNLLCGYDYLDMIQTQFYSYFGATRLTPVNLYMNGLFYNYTPGSVVRDTAMAGAIGQYDSGDDVDLLDPVTAGNQNHVLYRFPLSQMNFSGTPGMPALINVAQYAILHADNVNFNPNERAAAGANIYDPYEAIYMKNDTLASVSLGDWRLTNVNGNSFSLEAWMNGVDVGQNMKVGGMWFGDVLILSELVTGGCAAPTYNFSVQSDLWEGMIPSETVAALRSPNDDFSRVAQNIQKNAVLDPTGLNFQYPSTVFQDMKFGYREFVGVEIFHDDNRDCNLGWQYPGPVPPSENLFLLNLSDDYRQGKTGEAHIGMEDGFSAKDNGRQLSDFWPDNTNPTLPNGPALPDMPGPRFLDTLAAGGWFINNIQPNYYGVGESIYWDMDGDYEISPGDIRMTEVTVQRGAAVGFAEIIRYTKGSVVVTGDADIDMWMGQNNDLSDFVPVMQNGRVLYWPAYYDDRVEDYLNPGKFTPPNGVFDINEIIYTSTFNELVTHSPIVAPGFQRLMDVVVGGITYRAGSIVPEPDMWVYQMPIYGLSMGLNCDFNYADLLVLPGDTGQEVTVDGKNFSRTTPMFKVEKTSEIRVNFNKYPPKKEYYDEFGVFHPEEIIYVVVENVGFVPKSTRVQEMYRIVSGREPEAVFQFTPYRGSCTNSGSADSLNYLDTSSPNYYVRIRSYRDLGGINNPAPRDRDYNDEWYFYRNTLSSDARYGRSARYASFGKRVYAPSPMPPLPYKLENGYDCFKEDKGLVAPEEMIVEPSIACLTTLDQRFPNFSVTLKDGDNPEDINDPAGIRISIPLTETTDVNEAYGRDEYLISTYNAHGGGVEWIGTAIDDNPAQARRQYIVQVNSDGTYLYWYWLEPSLAVNDRSRPQLYGVLDSNDLLLGADFTGVILWKTGGGPYIPADQRTCRTPMMIKDKADWYDTDCSAGTAGYNFISCSPCTLEGMKKMGEVSGRHMMWNAARTMMSSIPARRSSDYYGRFDGVGPLNTTTTTAAWIAGINPPGPAGSGRYWTGPWATGFGVQTLVSSYGQRDQNDPGGDALIALLPRDGSTHINVQMYTTNALFDYNSEIPHPTTGAPYFVLDPLKNEGIDYCGKADLKVYPPDPYVNFVEWQIVDHALQYSSLNYTVGTPASPALSPLALPTPQIQTPYNPVLLTSKGEFRCYPGGQTHTGRVQGGIFGEGGAFGWNAYPAIFKEKYFKLGTEFFPLTDYGVFFILKDGEGNHLSFSPSWPVDQRIKRMEVTGPFARPREWDVATKSVLPKYKAWGLENVPIQYDWSGKLVIDQTNWNQFEWWGVDTSGAGVSLDFSRRSALVGNLTLPPVNTLLNYNGRLDYTMVGACSNGGVDNLFVLDELIPWNYGKINIQVTLWDGTFKIYQDCCQSPPVDGIDVKALDMKSVIEDDPTRDKLFLDKPQTVKVTLNEYHSNSPAEKEWTDAEGTNITPCNDAVMFAWQDRGVRHVGTGSLLYGAGDGWTTNVPTSSRLTFQAPQYEEYNDINKDGKVKYNSWETEIMGTYDLATNTWSGGLIDGRTFQRNNGLYIFTFNDNTALVDTVGLDFGGEVINDKQDHIIAKNEVLPVYFTAYKYGDDNNDRAFSPYWDMDAQAQANSETRRYSHEVYLAGQQAFIVEPDLDLTVLVTPEKLTAGVTPELVDVQKPLTFTITKGSEPMNLLEGVEDAWGNRQVREEDAWNYLFLDPHPDNTDFFGFTATLPQYYWVRTDLHNDDKTPVNNTQLYGARNCPEAAVLVPFNPITINFSQAREGRYVFLGFCANDNNQFMENFGDMSTMSPSSASEETWKDQHKFYVRVYTADRKHAGEATIEVFSPDVEYKITNIEDENRIEYESPASPDFIMTAADNRIYKVKVTCRDAMGVLLKGVTKGVSVCGGGTKNTARFTPFSTRPQSFDFPLETCMKPPCCTPVQLHIGFDFKPDDVIRKEDSELFQLKGFTMNRPEFVCSGTSTTSYRGQIMYNTLNRWWWGGGGVELPNTWDVYVREAGEVRPNIAWDLPPPNEGWGAGAIYNHGWHGGYMFSDIMADGKLNFRDALGLDVDASTEFYIFAEDIAYIGGLVGDNTYCNDPAHADLAGFPPFFDRTDPRYMEKRFRQAYTNDTVFFLDWDALPNNVATIDAPRITILNAENREPIARDYLDANNYDLVYGVENHLIAVVRPADSRDLPMKEDSRVYFQGAQHQNTIYGHTKRSIEDEKAVETTVVFTPTGWGENQAEVAFMAPNKWYLKDPYQFASPEYYVIRGGGMKGIDKREATDWNPWLFDVGMGLTLELKAEGDLYPKVEGVIYAVVLEAGTRKPISGAAVKLVGAGIDTELKTDKNGEAKFKVTPAEMGWIKGSAKKENYIGSPTATVKVAKDNTPPALTVDQPKSPTNAKSVKITGKAEPGSTVMVNGKPATVAADGSYSIEVQLVDGQNVITVVCKDAAGNTTTQTIIVVADFTPPSVIINKIPVLYDATTYELSGRVEPGSKVVVNGVTANVVNDYWKVEIPVKAAPDYTDVTIEATDASGNVANPVNAKITNVHVKIVNLQIGNTIMTVDGKEEKVSVAPEIIGGSTMLPMRDLVEKAFGGKVDWNAATKTATVTYRDTVIVVQIGNKEAIVNGVKTPISGTPPLIKGGSTLLPFRFIGEALGATVEWFANTKQVKLTLNVWP